MKLTDFLTGLVGLALVSRVVSNRSSAEAIRAMSQSYSSSIRALQNPAAREAYSRAIAVGATKYEARGAALTEALNTEGLSTEDRAWVLRMWGDEE